MSRRPVFVPPGGFATVGPGTEAKPTITVTEADVRVLVHANTIAKLVQMPRTKRWAIAVRGDGAQPSETYANRELAIDAIKAMYANGVPS